MGTDDARVIQSILARRIFRKLLSPELPGPRFSGNTFLFVFRFHLRVFVSHKGFEKIVDAAQVAAKVSHAFGKGLGDDRAQLSRILNHIGGSTLRLNDQLGPTSEKLIDKLKRKASADAFLRLQTVTSVVERCVAESRYHDAVKAYRRGCELTRACGQTPTPPEGCLDVLWHRFRQDKYWDCSVSLAKTLTEFGADKNQILARYVENAKRRAQQVSDIVYHSFKPTDDFETAYRLVCTRIVGDLIPFLIAILDTCTDFDPRGSEVVKEQVLFDFVSLQVQSLCSRFLTDVFLKTPHPPPSVQSLVGGVLRVRDALRPLHKLYAKLLSRIFMRFLHQVAKAAAKVVFDSSSSSFLETVIAMHTKLQRNEQEIDFGKLIEQIEHNAVLIVSVALTDCEPLLGILANDKNGKLSFVEVVYGHVTGFFVTFLNAVMAYTSGAVEKNKGVASIQDKFVHQFCGLAWNNLFILSLARMGLHFQARGVPKLSDVARDLMPESVMFPQETIADHCGIAINRALAHYTQVVGSKFVSLLQNHLASRNWLVEKEPREASVVITLLIKELAMVDAEVSHFVAEAPKRLTRTRRAAVSDTERLVARKSAIFTDPIPTRAGVMNGILSVTLKGLIEAVRQEFFGQSGVLQIRLDIGLLQNEIEPFVDDPGQYTFHIQNFIFKL